MTSTLNRAASVMIIAALTIGALAFAQTVFIPMAFALFAIAILWPLQRALQKRIPSGLALVVTILLALVIVVKLISVVAWGGGQIAQWFIDNVDRLNLLYAETAKRLEAHDIFVPAIIADRFDTSWLLRTLQQVATRLNGLLGFLVLTFIFLAMGLLEVEAFANNLRALGANSGGALLVSAGEQIGKKLRRYMLMRTLASLATGLVVWGFAFSIGLELAAAWGAIAFALNYIPFIGPLVATVLPTLFAFAQTGSWELALLVFVVLVIVQFLIGSYLEPLFTGKALAISSFVVVFSVFFWGFIWGLPGTFIGVPIAIAGLGICQQFPESRWFAALMSGQPPKPGTNDV